MQKNSDNFSMQEAMRLAKTDAGQQLIALMQAQDASAVSKAMRQAGSGDYDQLKKTLAPLLSSPEVQRLLTQLGGNAHE